MKQIIYTSSASIYFRPEMLEKMLSGFRKNNSKHGITGMLIYSAGTFLQLIEGPSEPVDRLIRNIIKDPVHHSVMIWENRTLKVRLFADWTMRFASVSNNQFGKMVGLAGQPLKADLSLSSPLASHMAALPELLSLKRAGANLT